jgi:BON domain
MRTDWSIRFDVCERLVNEPGLDHVYVSVQSGEVRLAGHVANRRMHANALRLVGDVPGVRAIKDELADEPDDEGDFAEEAGPKETEFGDEESAHAILSNDFEKAPP